MTYEKWIDSTEGKEVFAVIKQSPAALTIGLLLAFNAGQVEGLERAAGMMRGEKEDQHGK